MMMSIRKHSHRILAATLLLTPILSFSQTADSPSVPPGTEVTVKTIADMTSKTAKTGDKFEIEVASDVVIDQRTVIAAGTRGSGTVIFARAKRSGGVPGALDVRVDYIETPSGRLKLKASEANRGEDKRNTGTAAQMAFGLIGFLAVQGKETELKAGTQIRTVVAAPHTTNAQVPTAAATIQTPAPGGTAQSATTEATSVQVSENPMKSASNNHSDSASTTTQSVPPTKEDKQ